jgi:hypothetical protein
MPRRAIDMLTYLLQHDEHHRGQICMLARGLEHKFCGEEMTRLWGCRAIEADAGGCVRRPATKLQRSVHDGQSERRRISPTGAIAEP